MTVYRLGDDAPEMSDAERCWIAPSADVCGKVRLAEDVSIWFGAVVRADNEPMTIGARSNVQDGAVLHSDPGCPLILGVGVTVGHRAMLHGCTVGDNSLIGIGAIVLNRAVIGRNTLVGAGALVPEGKTFPDGVLLIGQPARVARELTPEQIAGLRLSAEHYVWNGKRFRDGLRAI